MKTLGKTYHDSAQRFAEQFASVRLGSKSADGTRRVMTASQGEQLAAEQSAFSLIATTIANVKAVAQDKPAKAEILPCVHRGSQRHTCCGSPNLWICRELKTDCVASSSDAVKLRQMVDTNEAVSIAVCQTCPHRKAELAGELFVKLWPLRETSPRTAPRVGFLSAAYMPIGGTETFHRSLLPRLNGVVDVAGFAATAFLGGDGSLLRVPYATGVESARTLAAHCDIIVTWGIHDLKNLLPANRPRVIAVHHSDWSSDWNNNMILNQLNLIDEVICVNEHSAAQLAMQGRPVYYIPNAVDPDRITPSGNQSALRSKFSISYNAKIVLFGHRINAEKRPLLAVEIARELPDGWVMVIAGDGPQLGTVEASAAGCDRVRIVGACESLADWLAISDCFLSLSIFEGFGLSICEAMAAGVPTVSTPTGIAPGLATILPTDSTAAEWADAIVNAKVIATAEFMLEQFSVHRMVDAWVDILKS